MLLVLELFNTRTFIYSVYTSKMLVFDLHVSSFVFQRISRQTCIVLLLDK